MPTRFYYEDGQGRIVDEQGNDVDWDEEVAPFHFKTLICIKQYCAMQGNEQTQAKEDLRSWHGGSYKYSLDKDL